MRVRVTLSKVKVNGCQRAMKYSVAAQFLIILIYNILVFLILITRTTYLKKSFILYSKLHRQMQILHGDRAMSRSTSVSVSCANSDNLIG